MSAELLFQMACTPRSTWRVLAHELRLGKHSYYLRLCVWDIAHHPVVGGIG